MDKKKLWMLLLAVALVLIIVLVVCLSSCQEKQGKLPRIGLCLRQYEEAPAYGQKLQTCLTEAGYDVSIHDAGNDQTRQTEQIKTLMDEDAVLLVIEPVIADAAEETVSILMENNVPAVFIGNKPENALSMWNRLAYVGCTEDQLGSLQGKIILQAENRGDLNEDGQVSCLVISGPEEDMLAQNHAKDSVGALVDEGLVVDQISTSWGDWTEDSGRIRCAKALSQYGKDVEVILCGNEALTLGALEAVSAGGWQIGRDYLLAGVGAEEKLQSDTMTGTVLYDLDGLAQQVLSTAKALLKEEAVEQECYVNLKTEIWETESE